MQEYFFLFILIIHTLTTLGLLNLWKNETSFDSNKKPDILILGIISALMASTFSTIFSLMIMLSGLSSSGAHLKGFLGLYLSIFTSPSANLMIPAIIIRFLLIRLSFRLASLKPTTKPQIQLWSMSFVLLMMQILVEILFAGILFDIIHSMDK